MTKIMTSRTGVHEHEEARSSAGGPRRQDWLEVSLYDGKKGRGVDWRMKSFYPGTWMVQGLSPLPRQLSSINGR